MLTNISHAPEQGKTGERRFDVVLEEATHGNCKRPSGWPGKLMGKGMYAAYRGLWHCALTRAGRPEVWRSPASCLPIANRSFDPVACFACCHYRHDTIEVRTQMSGCLEKNELLPIVRNYAGERPCERIGTRARLVTMQVHYPRRYRRFPVAVGCRAAEIEVLPEKAGSQM